MKLQFNIIEYVKEGKYYLTVGKKSPWNNHHIRIPVWVAEPYFFLKRQLGRNERLVY